MKKYYPQKQTAIQQPQRQEQRYGLGLVQLNTPQFKSLDPGFRTLSQKQQNKEQDVTNPNQNQRIVLQMYNKPKRQFQNRYGELIPQHSDEAKNTINKSLDQQIKIEQASLSQSKPPQQEKVVNNKVDAVENNKPKLPEIQKSPPNFSLIDQLYNNSHRQRQVPEEDKKFVGNLLKEKELIEYYSIEQNKEFNQKLLQKLSGFRKIRGGGNSFYTAFMVQFLRIVISYYTDDEFNNFLGETSNLPFVINYKDGFKITNDHSKHLSYEFLKMIVDLRKSKYKEIELIVKLGDPEGYLYGLSILYIRNLVNKFAQEDVWLKEQAEGIEYNISNDLLYWEKECNFNEQILKVLASRLHLHIVTYTIDQLKDILMQNQFGEQFQRRIAIILQPGFYTQAVERFT